jgi:hypothetical protein
MMSSYDHCKHFILDKGWIKHDNLYAHIWFVWQIDLLQLDSC